MDDLDTLWLGAVLIILVLAHYFLKRKLSNAKWHAFHTMTTESNGQLTDKDKVKRTALTQNLFLRDSIDFDRFSENLEILSGSRSSMEKGFGSDSIKEIQDFPNLADGFEKFFVAGYPDVYNWFQKNSGFGRIYDKEKLAALNEPIALCQFYRIIIDRYKNEGHRLECSIM